MKTTYLLLLNLILALTFRTAQAGDNDSAVREGRLSLDEVTNVVLANNPAIKAAQEKWQAMKARVPQAAAWEDLRAQARSRVARYVSIPPNAFTDQSFMLQQEVPISGKNLSRARAATAEAGAAFEDFRRTQARCTLARPRGLSSAGERICAARSKPTQRRPAQSIRRSKPPALRSWQRQSGRCAHCANRRGQAARSTVRYFPPNFRRAIAAQRADESASAVAARPAISDSVSTTALFIASVASCRPERATGNAASSKPGRSRKIPR